MGQTVMTRILEREFEVSPSLMNHHSSRAFQISQHFYIKIEILTFQRLVTKIKVFFQVLKSPLAARHNFLREEISRKRSKESERWKFRSFISREVSRCESIVRIKDTTAFITGTLPFVSAERPRSGNGSPPISRDHRSPEMHFLGAWTQYYACGLCQILTRSPEVVRLRVRVYLSDRILLMPPRSASDMTCVRKIRISLSLSVWPNQR